MHIKFFTIRLTVILISIPLFAVGCHTQTHPPSVPVSCDPGSCADNLYNTSLFVSNQTIQVAVADTESKRAAGLSNSAPLTDTQGMLFDFGLTNYARPSFWMKDMRFNLDLIWIKDGRIIGFTKNLPAPAPGLPDKALPSYSPPGDVNQVLEVTGGWVDKYKIKVGDSVRSVQ